jgi:hypothetical protein
MVHKLEVSDSYYTLIKLWKRTPSKNSNNANFDYNI